MSRLRFPEPFHHQHPPIRDVNEVLKEQLTPGLRAADWVAKTIERLTRSVGKRGQGPD